MCNLPHGGNFNKLGHAGYLPQSTSFLKVNAIYTTRLKITLALALQDLHYYSLTFTMTSQSSMRAVVFNGVANVTVEDRPVPQIQDARDAIVRVSVAALCGSDLHWYRGHQQIPTGFIPGHEFVGVVHATGNGVEGFKNGDIVVVSTE